MNKNMRSSLPPSLIGEHIKNISFKSDGNNSYKGSLLGDTVHLMGEGGLAMVVKEHGKSYFGSVYEQMMGSLNRLVLSSGAEVQFDPKDPIFLIKDKLPEAKYINSKACPLCATPLKWNQKGHCKFCGCLTCNKCMYRERIYPLAILKPDGTKKKGRICEMCDKKFFFREGYSDYFEQISTTEDILKTFQKKYLDLQKSMEDCAKRSKEFEIANTKREIEHKEAIKIIEDIISDKESKKNKGVLELQLFRPQWRIIEEQSLGLDQRINSYEKEINKRREQIQLIKEEEKKIQDIIQNVKKETYRLAHIKTPKVIPSRQEPSLNVPKSQNEPIQSVNMTKKHILPDNSRKVEEIIVERRINYESQTAKRPEIEESIKWNKSDKEVEYCKKVKMRESRNEDIGNRVNKEIEDLTIRSEEVHIYKENINSNKVSEEERESRSKSVMAPPPDNICIKKEYKTTYNRPSSFDEDENIRYDSDTDYFGEYAICNTRSKSSNQSIHRNRKPLLGSANDYDQSTSCLVAAASDLNTDVTHFTNSQEEIIQPLNAHCCCTLF